jgi:predicted amidohydrolase YtcJ
VAGPAIVGVDHIQLAMVDLMKIKDIKVVETIKEGKTIYTTR